MSLPYRLWLAKRKRLQRARVYRWNARHPERRRELTRESMRLKRFRDSFPDLFREFERPAPEFLWEP